MMMMMTSMSQVLAWMQRPPPAARVVDFAPWKTKCTALDTPDKCQVMMIIMMVIRIVIMMMIMMVMIHAGQVPGQECVNAQLEKMCFRNPLIVR